MRKHRASVGWPRHDPRHYRFPFPNTIWEYKLKPIEFVFLSYLCCQQSHGGTRLSPETVAKGVHISVSTVKKYLSSLVDRKLITGGWSLAPALQITGDRKFFTLPNEIFLLNLPSSAFMVYAYLLLIEDRKTHTCHPSYNTIAAATGMAKNTVMKSIGVLLDTGLIAMEHSRYIDQHGMKWNGNNLYTILPVGVAVNVFHQRQLDQLTLNAERRRICKWQEEYDRCHPRTPPCAPTPAPNDTPNPPEATRRCAPVERPCTRGRWRAG